MSEPALLHLRCHLRAGERARRTHAAQYIYRVAVRGDRGRTASFLERRGKIPCGYSAVGIDARELPRGQASAAVGVDHDMFDGLQNCAVITADGIEVILIGRRLQAAPRRSEVTHTLPRTQAAVAENLRPFHHRARNVVLAALTDGAAPRVEVAIRRHRREIKARFAQRLSVMPRTQAAV